MTTPVFFSLVGRSGSGKTTLITKLIPLFCELGLKVGSIKHTHHDVQLDKPGKDSWKHRSAGSSQVLLLTDTQLALYRDRQPQHSLKEIVDFWFKGFDLVISEGFKNDICLKIEVIREGNQKPPLYTDSSFNIQALVTDLPLETPLPRFSMDQADPLFRWVCAHFGWKNH